MATKKTTKTNGKLVGTDSADVLEIRHALNTVLAQGGADKITVYEGGGHKIYGRYGGDTVTITAGAGNGITVYGDLPDDIPKSAGSAIDSRDTVMVSGGSSHKIHGGAASDTITLRTTVGNGNYVYAGSGADDIKVYGGKQHKIYGDQGPDTILLTSDLSAYEQKNGVKSEVTVDGGSGQDTITVNGGSGHTIAGGAGPDTITVTITAGNNMGIDGGSGKDTVVINGGTGHTIAGGAGPDTITVALTAGNAMNIDGGSGEDTIEINGGTGHTIAGGKARDTITIHSGSGYTVDGGSAADTITLENVTDSKVAGGSEKDFITVNGGSKVNVYGGSGDDVITIKGGNQHTVYGEAGNDIIRITGTNIQAYGGSGGDTINGGTGSDQYTVLTEFNSQTLITIEQDNFKAGDADTLLLKTLKRDDVNYTLFKNILTVTDKKTGGKVQITAWRNNPLKQISFSDGTVTREEVNKQMTIEQVKQQSIIQNFMHSLDESTMIMESVETALNQAVDYASDGIYKTWSSLTDGLINDIKNYGATTAKQAKAFLEAFCGINIDNKDTGSITGADAGGAKVKTAESIVPEQGSISDLRYPSSETTTINGLTFFWPQVEDEAQIAVIKGINTWWAKEGLNLIEESFGLRFTEKDTPARFIDVDFEKSWAVDLASVTNSYGFNGVTRDLRLTINMRYWDETVATDVNGISKDGAQYLDRTLAHELTHAVMAASITGFNLLPKCIIEGSAELVHGIDDVRGDELVDYVNLSNSSGLQRLESTFSLSGSNTYYFPDPAYAGGYMLLRYFAKQVADKCNNAEALTSSDILNADSSGHSDMKGISSALIDFTEMNVSDFNLAEKQTPEQNKPFFITGNI